MDYGTARSARCSRRIPVCDRSPYSRRCSCVIPITTGIGCAGAWSVGFVPGAPNRGKSEPVFLNRSNQPLTRFGIHRLVTQYAEQASRTVPSMATKRVSPHTIRHTTAVHLLRAGVDINTIRAWLGHVSLDTTHVYAEVDMEMKAKALASVDISGLQNRPSQRPLPSLMTFLKAL